MQRPMASMRLKKRVLVYQQGLQGAEFRTLGPMASITLKKKRCTSRAVYPWGCRVQNLGPWDDPWQASD